MKHYSSIVILLASVAALAFGIIELFELRFEVGDVYPAYSSLRSDPLGTMAFCESLKMMPGLSVRRDFTAGNRLPEDLFKEIQAFLADGGRLAITFFPATARPSRFWTDDEEQDLEKSGNKKS